MSDVDISIPVVNYNTAHLLARMFRNTTNVGFGRVNNQALALARGVPTSCC